jgi:hypothetical protein
MTQVKNTHMRIGLAIAVGFVGLFASGDIAPNRQMSLISSAHAIIGRPLTPMSYAGVARRSTARAMTYGAVVAAPVVVAPVVVGPACAQVVNVYGQITTVCR